MDSRPLRRVRHVDLDGLFIVHRLWRLYEVGPTPRGRCDRGVYHLSHGRASTRFPMLQPQAGL